VKKAERVEMVLRVSGIWFMNTVVVFFGMLVWGLDNDCSPPDADGLIIAGVLLPVDVVVSDDGYSFYCCFAF
jgi:hypothetical protein